MNGQPIWSTLCSLTLVFCILEQPRFFLGTNVKSHMIHEVELTVRNRIGERLNTIIFFPLTSCEHHPTHKITKPTDSFFGLIFKYDAIWTGPHFWKLLPWL